MSVAEDFVQACADFENATNFKPIRCRVSESTYRKFISECGLTFRDPRYLSSTGRPELNGVELEVVSDV